MNKKRNTIITIIIITCIFLAGAIFYLLTFSKDESSLTVLEKKWISDNLNKVIDIDVYNDIPIFGYNGEGMIFDFLNYTTKENQINFNKISYYTNSEIDYSPISFQVLKNNEKIEGQDIVLYEDYYAIYTKDKQESINLNQQLHLGYLNEDEKVLKDYFPKTVELTSYENIEDLVKAFQENQIDHIVLPSNKYMDVILKNKYQVSYHLTDLKLNYILRAKDETIYQILKKSYLNYIKNEYETDYSKNYLKLYFDSTNTSDLLRKNYNAKTYKYGYVVNMPYENNVQNEFVGTISNYLKDFNKVARTDIEVVAYKSIDELKSALIRGEVDFALSNFDYSTINLKYNLTNSIADLKYVVLSKKDYFMNSVKGLQSQKVTTVKESKLYQLCKENSVQTLSYDNTDELLRNIDDNSIILLDKQTYLYYKDNKLKDYKINYESSLSDGYHFIMNASNETFNQLFNYYVSNISYDQIKYLYRTDITIDKDYSTIKTFIFITILVLILVVSTLIFSRKTITNKTISKDEVLKYIDPMTSLKNRNYLNFNIYDWDDNVIFPQSVIVFDLNQLKEVNDTLGREAGDEIIKKVASVLINNQLENTDIIRSGGDEFLIYLVGYDEKYVMDYAKKITKLMKNIPNSLGCEYGYSMILDEVKTVDDAINEAIAMMMKNKAKRK
ncbi:MAG: GGDEF domain-containing protein [Bacilli bacterium]|nr:GGDEF domain-containing protein [Bacilli bacterium]